MCVFSALTAVLLLCLLISSAWVQDLSKKCSVGSGHEFLTTPVSNDRNRGQAVSLLAESRKGGLDRSSVWLSRVVGVSLQNHRRICKNMLRCWPASHAARRVARDDRQKEMPLSLWKVLDLFLKLTLASLCSSPQEIKNRFWLLSQNWKSQAWFAQCPVVLSNLTQRENIKLVNNPKWNNTAIGSKKKMPRVPLYQTGEGRLLMGSQKLIFSNVFVVFPFYSLPVLKDSLAFCKCNF